MFISRDSQKWVFLCCLLSFIHNINARLSSRQGHLNTTSTLLPSLTSSPAATVTAECGLCVIEATGGVQLIYWAPDDVKSPSNITYKTNQPYTQVENGFTFTSPSIYVVYSKLGATVSATGTCPQGLPVETVGPYFEAYTTAYSDSFLAYGTLQIEGPGCTEDVIVGGFHTIDFSSLYHNPISPTTTYKAGCAPYVNPRISMALDLTGAVPAWASCQPLYYGAFDPPSILTKESQLVPPVGGPGHVKVTSTGLAPPTALPAEAPAAPTPDRPASTLPTTSAPQPTLALADSLDVPPKSPVAPLAEPVNVPTTMATQSSPNRAKTPANPAAVPPADPQNVPANAPALADPRQRAPVNTPYNPSNLTPEQVAQLKQAFGDDSSPSNPTPNEPAPDNSAPHDPASNDPAPNSLGPNNPAPKNGPAPKNPMPINPGAGPTQLQAIPNDPPAASGNPAPEGPTQLQAIPVDSPDKYNPGPAAQTSAQPNLGTPVSPNNLSKGGSPAPSIPGQSQNNVDNPPVGGNGNPAPASSDQPPANLNTPLDAGPNPSSAAPAVALPVATAPIYLGITQPISVGGQPVQKAPDGGLLIGGQSIAQGSHTTVAGSVVSVGTSNVAICGSTYALPAVAGPNPVALGTPAPLSIGGQAAQYAPGSSGGLLIGGQTLAAGQQATVQGTIVSVGTTDLAIGGSTYALPVTTAATPPAIDGQPLQQAPNGAVRIAGQTIGQGSQATIQGTIISLGPPGIVIAGNTYAHPTPPLEIAAPVPTGGAAVHQLSNGALSFLSNNPTSPTPAANPTPTTTATEILLPPGTILTETGANLATSTGPALSASIQGTSALIIGSAATIALGATVTALPAAALEGIINSALASSNGNSAGAGAGAGDAGTNHSTNSTAAATSTTAGIDTTPSGTAGAVVPTIGGAAAESAARALRYHGVLGWAFGVGLGAGMFM